MLLRNNFTLEHIKELQAKYHRDPSIIEKTIFAFGLLEALVRSGLIFTFKGGTSLMLLLARPMRLSTDIDIVVAPDTKIDRYIAEAGKIFPFVKCDEQVRKGKNGIIKRHFKFSYISPVLGRDFYILLDILFEENNYAEIVNREIKNDLLLTDGESLQVQIPSPDCMIGDKLTAFAPHTTGIPFGVNKELEIIKQLYDVATLIDLLDNFENIKKTYKRVAASEIRYRGIDIKLEDALTDSLNGAACILARGNMFKEDYPLYFDGIKSIRNYVYGEELNGETILPRAAKVMNLVANLIAGNKDIHLPREEANYSSATLNGTNYRRLDYLKRKDIETYSYVYEAVKML